MIISHLQDGVARMLTSVLVDLSEKYNHAENAGSAERLFRFSQRSRRPQREM